MTAERIKEIQQTTPYPNSISIYSALMQVWNEVEQEKDKKETKKPELKSIDFLSPMQKINAIISWQKDERMHPLTCNCITSNNNEKKFEFIGIQVDGNPYLECTKCGVVQKWIPDVVYQRWIENNV